MLRQLFVSALFLCGAVTLIAPSTRAQTAPTVDIPFSGTVSNGCTFGTPTPGTLAVATVNLSGIPAQGLSSTSPGTASTVDLNCGSSTVNVTISAPVKGSGPNFTGIIGCFSVLTPPSGPPTTFTAPALTCSGTSGPISVTSGVLGVGMGYGSSSGTVPLGTYSYTVTLSIVP
jgi:hypothetical protein